MFNKSIIAALFAASFTMTAKAQSINIINQCGEPKRIVTFNETDGYGVEVLKTYNIKSHCIKEEFPTYRLPVGNYVFENLNIAEDEQWFVEIKKAGVITRKGFLTLGHFDTILSEDMTIQIIISPKLKCNCN